MPHLIRQNATGSDVVPVAESTGETEDLEIPQQLRPFEQPIDMRELGVCPRCFKRESCFLIAIGTGGTQN
jgi:hypothetical protein